MMITEQSAGHDEYANMDEFIKSARFMLDRCDSEEIREHLMAAGATIEQVYLAVKAAEILNKHV